MKIPDYYRQFQNQPAEEKKKETPSEDQNFDSDKNQEQKKTQQASQEKDRTIAFQGNGFIFNQLENWEDKTIYTLTGPVIDGIQHNVIITKDKDVQFDYIIDYAEYQIKTLETELKGCSLLKKGGAKLTNGMDAYEAIFSWFPSDDIKIYQHQIYVLVGKTAYKLTASFTKKTRQTLGSQVLRMMLSFDPETKK